MQHNGGYAATKIRRILINYIFAFAERRTYLYFFLSHLFSSQSLESLKALQKHFLYVLQTIWAQIQVLLTFSLSFSTESGERTVLPANKQWMALQVLNRTPLL